MRRAVQPDELIKLAGPALRQKVTEPDIAPQYRRMLALYLSSILLLEQNRIWSWQELAGTLGPSKGTPAVGCRLDSGG